jgi:hypothetical protein
MQIKSIKKTIASKMDEWINSITDEVLRKELKNNVLVSGGSITSMFLNEPINDFDVYLKDKNVLFKLVEYYCKPFNIEILDGNKRDEYLEELAEAYHLKTAEEADEILYNKRRISLSNLKEGQVKLNVYQGAKVNQEAKKDLKYIPKFFSPNAISLSDQIQIVCRFHGDDTAIHKTFDFIHATKKFTYELGVVTNKEALESILCKQLKYQGSLYPLTSIIRMKKFIKRGWGINAGEILKIMFQISELDLTNPDVLEEQLIGVDVAYFGALIEILRGLPPTFKMTSAYLNCLIDKVFNEDEDINIQ